MVRAEGLRHGKLLPLRWSDVDLDVGRLTVRRNLCERHIGTPKGGRGRDIPLCDSAVMAHDRAHGGHPRTVRLDGETVLARALSVAASSIAKRSATSSVASRMPARSPMMPSRDSWPRGVARLGAD
jgi:integrase